MNTRGALLLIKCGAPPPAVLEAYGDFERYFADRAGLAVSSLQSVDVSLGAPLPDPAGVAGVIVSGSAAMVSDRLPWSEAAATWIARAASYDMPMLGVCYGHQLLVRALGGRVDKNRHGRQIGTIAVSLAPNAQSDALFGVLPPLIKVQVSHSEVATHLPQGARILGSCAKDPHHMVAFKENIWGVQFHPEFDAAIVRGYIAAREPALREEGLDPAFLSDSSIDSPHGAGLLQRFAEIVLSS